MLSLFSDGLVDELCVILDSPESEILKEVETSASRSSIPLKLMSNKVRRGIGSAIRQGLEYAVSNGFTLAIIMAGNGKDNPLEIPRMLDPIINNGCDYVQGSRYLRGGRPLNTPPGRFLFTRLFPLLWTAATRFRCTDVTNGFRAYKINILGDARINVRQKWLDGYALEYYLHYKAITLGYKVAEVPVSKIYRKSGKYTQISPLKHWWEIVGPLVSLHTGLRR